MDVKSSGVVSSVVGLTFALPGIFVYSLNDPFPNEIGLPIFGYGAFILLVGWYVHFMANPSVPNLRSGEELRERRNPSQKVAFAKMILSIPFLLLTVSLMFFTMVAYIIPLVTFLIGLYLLSSGLVEFWKNTVTAYFITDRRIIGVYNFISLDRKEIRLEKIRGVREKRSPMQTQLGIGNVHVASGAGGGSLAIDIRNVDDSGRFADKLRQLA
ncbi:PH domain-containing protein [Haladaptatus sp. F3-133]|uniref:PH domain-containing protein n=1 Tax=Halorutilus salinus TaxID=2487751 RepID=A0A9Q4GJ01_9EURY|nr:PH domain-containing protein [Halorutilus salinus]MCX2818766.1 PH domain-containing protein [Halorutilus salinus]